MLYAYDSKSFFTCFTFNMCSSPENHSVSFYYSYSICWSIILYPEAWNLIGLWVFLSFFFISYCYSTGYYCFWSFSSVLLSSFFSSSSFFSPSFSSFFASESFFFESSFGMWVPDDLTGIFSSSSHSSFNSEASS